MKPALVLIPGLLCDERLWRHQSMGLAALADPILVPGVTGHDSVGGMAGAVLEEAPERFALAGLSMGGYVALEVVRQAPERVAGLALLDTSARPDTPGQTKTRLALIEMARDGRFDEVWRTLLPKIVHPGRVDDPNLVSAVEGMALSVGPGAFERQERAIIGRPDSRVDLPNISCPTLVLCGRDDAPTPPPLHEELAEGIPGARLRFIDRCGHLSTLERPEETTDAMRGWLGVIADRGYQEPSGRVRRGDYTPGAHASRPTIGERCSASDPPSNA